ncbi:MAG: 16S rRNA (guanine(527)-N(7))-methyltransferase RsmG [Alphaproteobacteria bacterium]|nr:16S rRNA (guanine(527)-N(7))-methyltransferase RsmG [Alphaproteobacteria bacterium]
MSAVADAPNAPRRRGRRLPALTPAGFQAATGVSRETLRRLEQYYQLLCRWQRAINLVGDDTLSDGWRRHMLDSAQLFPLLPARAAPLIDLGSGAGFPGLVLAIMGAKEVHLVERDQRKAAFLATAARATGTPVTLHVQSADTVAPLAANVITARALAPLPDLLALAEPFISPATLCLFPKGARAADELAAARARWHVTATSVPSQTDPTGTILCLREVHRHAA